MKTPVKSHAAESETFRLVKMEITELWKGVSIDEKMTNSPLERRIRSVMRVMSVLNDYYQQLENQKSEGA